MTFALAAVGWGLPQVAGAVFALVVAIRRRHRAPRAARWAQLAAAVELLLVVADLALLGSADLVHSLTYATEQMLNTVSDFLVLASVIAVAPMLYAIYLDRNLRLPALPRQGASPAAGIPPGTRARWEQVLPPRGPSRGGGENQSPPSPD